ncbi:AMP phosphorylase [Candidatus Micrarchaeota archaeon]|nr:AMP phosphorylase [Candidatus Micrarchaeota archaeon]
MVEYVEKSTQKVDVWKLKTYMCKVKTMDIYTGRNIIVLNKDEAKEHDIYAGYRTKLNFRNKSVIAIVDVSDEIVRPGEVGVFRDLAKEHKLKNGEKISIVHMDRPESIGYIKKKLDKETLSEYEVKTIVSDIMMDRLSEIETAAWISGAYINGLSDDEIIALAHATVESGDRLDLGKKGPVLDKHCIGGVAGNRTTMVIVPLIAAAGLYIPKTSSRSITSASGTADTMEVLANVTFTIDELKEIVLKAKGAIVWGGGMELAPVDDKLIRIRHPLSLDPEGMLLASILGKKKSVGAQHVVIDIPVGRGVKVPYIERGNHLAKHFLSVGNKMGMNIEALITDGAEPVGHGIGPALECIDVLEVLEGKGKGPDDLRHKSLLMTGKLLELCGKVRKNDGYRVAQDILDSGKALKKFREIIELQDGDPKVKASDIEVGQYKHAVTSKVGGSIFHIDNKTMAKIARIAGSPRDRGAGVLIHKFRGDRVERGERLFTIYAESEAKLDFALKALEKLEPIEMRKMLLGSVG